VAEQLGSLVGRDALDRGCRGLLAPTVNLHRSPWESETSSAARRTRSCRGASPPPTFAAFRRTACSPP
jgi:hypothetical protein